MVASIGLILVSVLLFELLYLSYFISNFDQVCYRLHGIIRVVYHSDSLAFHGAINL